MNDYSPQQVHADGKGKGRNLFGVELRVKHSSWKPEEEIADDFDTVTLKGV